MKFKPALIEALNLDEALFMLISACYDHGYETPVTEGSNKGSKRLELPFAAGLIHFPSKRPLSPIMPPGIPPVTTEEAIENYFVKYLMNTELEPQEEYRYSVWINGVYLNKATGELISQLDWCIRHLKKKGFGNNHCFITVGDPLINFNYDFPYSNETERRTSPCLRGLDIKVKDNRVILGIIYRSWDLFAGFPQNMGGFTLLNEYIANELDIEPGPLTFSSQGLHCYDYQTEAIIGYLRR